jgi:hypothetical protein
MSAARPRATRLLDVGQPAELEQFERAFYAGFAAASHNRLVRWLWEWDHEARRLRTRIPYGEQRIWILETAAGELAGAIAVNLALRTLQAAAYGFAVPPGVAPGAACEFLTFFSIRDFSLAAKHALWTEMFDDLRTDGRTLAFATTAPRIMPMYRRMGAQVLGETSLEGEIRYFLQFDLARTAVSGPSALNGERAPAGGSG